MIGGDRDERLVTYLLIANSFDGTMSVTVAIVMVRVVCSNTLSLALDTAQRTFRVQHTGSLDGRLAEARRALEISFRYREEMRMVGEGLLARSVSDSEFERFLAELVPVPEKEGRGRTMALRRQEEVRHIYRNAEDLANVRGTAWGVLQAVAEWDTHVAPVRSVDPRRVGERRLERVLMAQTLAGRAFELLAA
jgi:phage/plasmid-like protein (TIGR03299 family)